MSDKNWVVECDGERWFHRTREEARRHARWINNHPANVNVRNFGPYSNADGVARVWRRDG